MARRKIDLHGYSIGDAEAAVDRFLYEAQQSGFDQVEIVTGKGTGAIYSAVCKYLKAGGYPYKTAKGRGGKPNPGALTVILT